MATSRKLTASSQYGKTNPNTTNQETNMSSFDSYETIAVASRKREYDAAEQAKILGILNKTKDDNTLVAITQPSDEANRVAAAVKHCVAENKMGLSIVVKDNKDGTKTVAFGGRKARAKKGSAEAAAPAAE